MALTGEYSLDGDQFEFAGKMRDGCEGVADGGFEVEVSAVEAGGSVLQEGWRGGGDSGEDEWDEVCAEVWVGFAAQGEVTDRWIHEFVCGYCLRLE